jgi:RecA-family ATPase
MTQASEEEMLDVVRQMVEDDQRGNSNGHDEPLPYVDLALDLVPRGWLVLERIPHRNVTVVNGEGAIGKSLLLMQLSGATVLARDWIGTLPEPGPVLYMSCEEDDDEVRRRMEDVARHLGSTRKEMIEHGLHVLSFAGRDAILAQPDRSGIIRPTPLFERIRRDALQLKPKLIVFDTVADIFGGNEVARSQTRQFITLLRGLAIECDSAVVMSAHPSLTGISSGSGLSGSTQWHNGPRARMYLHPAPGEDTALRVLEVMKTNYGPVSESIVLRWKDGVYVVEPGKGTLERLAAEAEVEQLFLKLLRRYTEQGRNVSDNKSPTYAPSLFAKEPEAKEGKITKQALEEAMARLFAAKRLRTVTFGSASRMRSRIVEVGTERGEPATILPFPTPLPTPLPTPFQHPSNGVLAHTPHTPPPVGSGQGGVGSPPPSNGQEGKSDEAAAEITRLAKLSLLEYGPQRKVAAGKLSITTKILDTLVAAKRKEAAPPVSNGEEGKEQPQQARDRLVLIEWKAAIGIGRTATVDEAIAAAADHPGLRAALMAVAPLDGARISNVLLARWLRTVNEVVIEGLMLRGDGPNRWTLEAHDA